MENLFCFSQNLKKPKTGLVMVLSGSSTVDSTVCEQLQSLFINILQVHMIVCTYGNDFILLSFRLPWLLPDFDWAYPTLMEEMC